MKDLNRKREEQFYARISVLFAAATLMSIGCAHASRKTTHQMPARGSTQVISPEARQKDPLTALEQELATVHSERVIVSTALLRSLVKNERIQQRDCKHISGQLEALKNIDLEETGESKE